MVRELAERHRAGHAGAALERVQHALQRLAELRVVAVVAPVAQRGADGGHQLVGLVEEDRQQLRIDVVVEAPPAPLLRGFATVVGLEVVGNLLELTARLLPGRSEGGILHRDLRGGYILRRIGSGVCSPGRRGLTVRRPVRVCEISAGTGSGTRSSSTWSTMASSVSIASPTSACSSSESSLAASFCSACSRA